MGHYQPIISLIFVISLIRFNFDQFLIDKSQQIEQTNKRNREKPQNQFETIQ